MFKDLYLFSSYESVSWTSSALLETAISSVLSHLLLSQGLVRCCSFHQWKENSSCKHAIVVVVISCKNTIVIVVLAINDKHTLPINMPIDCCEIL